MTPQELKNSILQMAIQGKLVEQRPEEGNAEELYKNIQAEKQELIKAGKIKKEKVLPKPEEEEAPFDIPENWTWAKLGAFCEMYTGNSIPEAVKQSKYTGLEEGYDYIGTKDVSFNQSITYNNGVRIPFNENFKVAYKGSVLMCIEGGSAGKKIAVLDRDVCFGNKLCMFNPSGISNLYLFYYLQSQDFRTIFAERMTGIIGGVSIKKLKDAPIPLPPLAEQQRIVSKIDELLSLIDRYGESWSRLEELNKRFPGDMRRSLLQMAIQGKLVEQRHEEGNAQELYKKIQAEKQELIKAGKIKKDKALPEIAEEEIPFEIPENWMWVRLGNLGVFVRGSGIKRDETSDTPGKPCVRYGQLYTTYKTRFNKTISFVSDEVFNRCQKVHKNDILMALTGENNFDIALRLCMKETRNLPWEEI